MGCITNHRDVLNAGFYEGLPDLMEAGFCVHSLRLRLGMQNQPRIWVVSDDLLQQFRGQPPTPARSIDDNSADGARVARRELIERVNYTQVRNNLAGVIVVADEIVLCGIFQVAPIHFRLCTGLLKIEHIGAQCRDGINIRRAELRKGGVFNHGG